MGNAYAKLADFIEKYPKQIIIVWIVALLVTLPIGIHTFTDDDVLSYDMTNMVDDNYESVQGLHTMARACVEYADGLPAGEDQDYYRLYSEAIAGYLAERFANRPRETMEMAGNLVQDLSRFYAERNMTVASEHLQQLFYSLYPEHSTAASSLMG